MTQFVRFADWNTLLDPYSGNQPLMQETIEHLVQNPLLLKKKRFGQKIVFTHAFDLDGGTHRLIFERVEHEKQTYFILRSVAFNHEYGKALTWNPLKKDETAQLAQNTTTIAEQKIDIDEDEDEKVRVFHQSRWLTLNPHQEAILNDKSKLKVVVGPPGSGKTLLSLALLQERALAHEQSGQGASLLKLLYLAPEQNQGLKRTITQEWKTWQKEHLLPNTNVMLVIQNIDEFTTWYFEEEQQKVAVDDSHCLSFLNRLTRDEAQSQLFYQELCLASVLLNDDRKHKRPFDKSHYQGIGQQQSVMLQKQDREVLFKLYMLYLHELEKENQYHSKLSAFSHIDRKALFNLVVADEAQLYTTQQLLNAWLFVQDSQNSQDSRCVFFGDDRQNTKHKSLNISPLMVMQPFFHTISNNTLDVNIQTLEKTYRLPPEIARIAEQVFYLQDNLRGGVPDKYSYQSIASVAKLKTGGIHFITEYNETYKRFRQDAGVAAIALDEIDLKKAAEQIDTQNAFTSLNAHGLEFPRVWVFVSKRLLTLLRPLSREMEKRGIPTHAPLTARKHRTTEVTPLEIEEGLELLRKLFVALSRSSGEVSFYFESESLAHDLNYFIQWFAYQCGVVAQKTPEMHLEISTDEEWIKTINHLILNQHRKQARDNLFVHFDLAEKEANLYIEEVLQKHHESPQLFLDFIQTLKTSTVAISSSKPSITAEQAPVSALESHTAEASVQGSQPSSSRSKKKKAASHTSTTSNNGHAIPSYMSTLELNKNNVFNVLATVLKNERPGYWLCEYQLPSFEGKTLLQLILESQEQSLALYFRLAADLPCLTTFLKAIGSYVDTSPPAYQEKNITYLQLIILRIGMKWSEDFATSFLKALPTTLNPSKFNQPFSFNSDENVTIPYLLLKKLPEKHVEHLFNPKSKLPKISEQVLCHPVTSVKEKGLNALCLLLANHPKTLALHWKKIRDSITAKVLHQTAIMDEDVITPFYLLSLSPEGRHLLDSDWSFFKGKINQDQLHQPVTGNGPEHSATPFYRWCDAPDGIDLLHNHWDFFKGKISRDQLHHTVKGNSLIQEATAFFLLCKSPEGMKLLHIHWDFFKNHITQDLLSQPITGNGPHQGCTPFFLLCKSQEGINLLLSNWDFFKDFITQDLLSQPITASGPHQGTTPFYLLCQRPEVINLMNNQLDFFKNKISKELMHQPIIGNGPYQGISPFYLLCQRPEGINLLNKQWHFFKDIISKELLHQPVTGKAFYQGVTPFGILCRNPVGIDLVLNHWLFFKDLVTVDFLLQPHLDNLSIFVMLCMWDNGLKLILYDWTFFKDVMRRLDHQQMFKLDGSLESSYDGRRIKALWSEYVTQLETEASTKSDKEEATVSDENGIKVAQIASDVRFFKAAREGEARVDDPAKTPEWGS